MKSISVLAFALLTASAFANEPAAPRTGKEATYMHVGGGKCIEARVPRNIVTPSKDPGVTGVINRDALNKIEVKVVPCPPANKQVNRVAPVRVVPSR